MDALRYRRPRWRLEGMPRSAPPPELISERRETCSLALLPLAEIPQLCPPSNSGEFHVSVGSAGAARVLPRPDLERLRLRTTRASTRAVHIDGPLALPFPLLIGTYTIGRPLRNLGRRPGGLVGHAVSWSAMCRPCRSAASHSAWSALVRTVAPTKSAAARWTAS